MRFPGFSDEWTETTLSDVADVIKERINTSSLRDNYISTESLISNFGGVQTANSIPSDTNVIRFKENDVLISNIRPYLRKVWFADKEGGCSADVFVFRAKGIEPSFLYNTIANDSFINYVMSGAKGVKMPRGDKQQMMKYPLFVPSIEEQKRISRLLSLLDERIATQKKIIDNLQSLIKGLRERIFAPLLPNLIKLGAIADIKNGSGDVQDAVSEYSDGLFPFFDRSEEIKYFSSFGFDAEAIIYAGEGAEFLPRYYNGKFALHQRCYAITNFNKDFIPRFVYHFLYTQNNYFIRKAVGSTVPSLRMDTFQNIGIPIIDKALQSYVSNKLDSICRLYDYEKHILGLYWNQKDYLLQNLFI